MDPIRLLRLQMQLDALLIAAFAIIIVAARHQPLAPLIIAGNLAAAIVAAIEIAVIRSAISGLESDRLDDLERSEKRMETLSATRWIINATIIATDLISAVSFLMDGRVVNAVVDLLVAALLLYFVNRDRGAGRRAAEKLIGEKSKALRDKLVEAMPNPGVQTA